MLAFFFTFFDYIIFIPIGDDQKRETRGNFGVTLGKKHDNLGNQVTTRASNTAKDSIPLFANNLQRGTPKRDTRINRSTIPFFDRRQLKYVTACQVLFSRCLETNRFS